MTNSSEAPMANAIDDVKDDRSHMGTATEAKAALIERAKAWREYRQPSMATAAEHKKRDARDREAQIALANACLLWLWHEENPTSPAPSQHTGWSDEAVEAAAKALWERCDNDYKWHEAITEPELASAVQWARDDARAALTAASSIAPATGFEVAAQRLKAAYIAETGSTMWPTDEQFRRILAASSISPSVAKESGEP